MSDRVAALATVPAPPGLATRLGLAEDDLHLRRAWPRGPEHLLVEYATADGRRVAGQWHADPRALERIAAATRAVARHPDDVAVLPRLGLLLQAGGADRRLRPLASLVARRGARLVVHRPERRAVVRLGRGECARYAKVVRPDRVDGMAATARAVAQALAADAPPAVPGRAVAVPTPELVDRLTGVVVTGALPGTALHDGLASPQGVAAWWAAGEALRRLHDLPPPPGAGTHDASAETAVLDTWLEHVRAHRPAWAEALRPAVAAAREALAALAGGHGAGLPALVHRDWHDKNVLVDVAGRVGLLDLDTVAVGDGALDLANALVHLELRVLQGRCSAVGANARARALVAGYDPPPAVRERLVAYAAATRVRLACVYAFRPGTDARPLVTDVLRPPALLVSA